MRNFLVKAMALGLGVVSLLTTPRLALAEEYDSLYQEQMSAYTKLNADRRKHQEALLRLRETLNQKEVKRRQLASKLKELSGKISSFQAQQAENERKIAQKESEIKTLEAEVINRQREYWKEQKGYGVYQSESARLLRDQNDARKKIKSYFAQNAALAKKLNALQGKYSVLIDQDRELEAQMKTLNKDIEQETAPLPGGRSTLLKL